VYANDAFDDLLGEAKCFECGKTAVKRCSRCRNAWYCGRKCQVKNWDGHKKVCNLICSAEKSEAKAKAKAKKAKAKAAQAATARSTGAGVGVGAGSGSGAGVGTSVAPDQEAQPPTGRVLVEEVVE